MTLPTPPQPPTDPTPEAVAAWERDMAAYDGLARMTMAYAQQATADAMNRYSDIVGEIPAGAPPRPPTKEELVREFAKQMPQRATDTPNSYYDAVATMVGQFLKEHGAQ